MEVGAWDILCLAVVVESVVETEAFPSWLPSSVTATRYWILVLVQKETETTKEGTVSVAWRAACNERIFTDNQASQVPGRTEEDSDSRGGSAKCLVNCQVCSPSRTCFIDDFQVRTLLVIPSIKKAGI